MTKTTPAPEPQTSPEPVRTAAELTDRRMLEIVSGAATVWPALSQQLAAPTDELVRFIGTGGKRLRPALCHIAGTGLGLDPENDSLLGGMAAVEFLHAFALISDDVMDESSVRRGMQTLHVRHERQHRSQRLRGDPQRYGQTFALLVADLAFVCADIALARSDVFIHTFFNALRTELLMGQYLDVRCSATAVTALSPETALTIATMKSGRYTVRRPLELGSLLAGAGELKPLAQFGDALGLAYQFQDDLIGTFGGSATSGKPTDSDIRNGRPTYLYAIAMRHATRADRDILSHYGHSNLTHLEVDDIRQAISRVGAKTAVVAEIQRLVHSAMVLIDALPFTVASKEALADLSGYMLHPTLC